MYFHWSLNIIDSNEGKIRTQTGKNTQRVGSGRTINIIITSYLYNYAHVSRHYSLIYTRTPWIS
jgi:hypothetical protein